MKKSLRVIALTLLAGTVIVAVLVWLLGRETTLTWIAGFIETRTQGSVRFEDPRGSLYGPFHVARFVYESPTVRVELNDVEVDWDLRQLWQRHVSVRAVRAQSLVVMRKGGPRPEKRPISAIRLPVSLDIASARISRIDVMFGRRYLLSDVSATGRLPRGQDASAIEIEASANDGAVVADARLQLDVNRAFALSGRFAHLDLAAISALPRSDIVGRVSLAGALEPAWRADFALDLADSRVNEYPLSGRARLTADSGRIHELDADLRVGRNSIFARGAFGAEGDVLSWRIDAPALQQLGRGFAGRVRSSGTLRGSFARPALRFSVDASNLAFLGRHVVKHAKGQGELGAGERDRVEVNATVDGYALGRFEIDHAEMNASGTRVRHDVRLRVRNRFLNAQASARGGLDADGWHGRILSLSNAGEYETRLQGEAQLLIGRNRFVLSDATLSAGPGAITVLLLQKEGETMRTRGAARGIALSYLQAFAATPLPIKSSLTLSADWDLTAGERLDGEIRIAREIGDVVLDTLPPQALGLTNLKAQIRVAHNLVEAEVLIAGALPGDISARARTMLTHAGGTWGIAATAPLSVSARADVRSLAWLGVFTRDKLAFGGTLTLDAQAEGTFAQPHWQGQVLGRNLVLRVPEQGVDLGNGTLSATFRDERLIVERLQLRGGEGAVEARGHIDILGTDAEFEIDADQLRAIHTPLRDIVLGGKGRLVLRDRRLDMGGQIKVERARIEVPERAAPTLSEDIVVVGQEQAAEPRKRKRWIEPVLDVHIDLGEKVFLQASGLDARLAGNVRVRASEAGLPQASGTIRIAAGKYSAYGQSLEVERGVITFTGPIDNPGLNILAVRKIPAAQVSRATAAPPSTATGTTTPSVTTDQGVQVGVSVTGTALAPVVRLVSTPDMPDGEKLSWLVLGHGLDRASGGEIDLLGAAASALLERGESVSLQSRIAQQTGLDEFRLKGGGGLESAIVTVGKRLSADVYLSYERSVTGTTNLMRIRYALTQKWSVQTETGSNETGSKGTAVDLFYTFSFD